MMSGHWDNQRNFLSSFSWGHILFEDGKTMSPFQKTTHTHLFCMSEGLEDPQSSSQSSGSKCKDPYKMFPAPINPKIWEVEAGGLLQM